jgi:hypothetical protein
LGRHGIGIELLPTMVKKAREIVEKELNFYNVVTEIVEGDSTQQETIDKVKFLLKSKLKRDTVQLI